ncbi:MAG: hypothetical protein ABW185_01915, partial [Sedimenticola sp.]
ASTNTALADNCNPTRQHNTCGLVPATVIASTYINVIRARLASHMDKECLHYHCTGRQPQPEHSTTYINP